MRPARTRSAVLVLAAALALTACTSPATPGPGSTSGPGSPEPTSSSATESVTTTTARFVAVGDIARSGGGQAKTAAVVKARAPWRLFDLGDNAYPNGSLSDYTTWYAPYYGQFKSITWPVPGNHEYQTAGAAGYRSYFGVTGPTWWAHRIGGWIILGLDSEKASSTTQLAFIERVLTTYNHTPVVVTWHRPRYSLGYHGDATDVQPLWAAIATDPDVKLVLWGHDHDYERMSVPVSGRATRLTAMVVGTGGAELRAFSTRTRSWSLKRIANTYGVLDLRLRSTSFSWYFVRTDGVVADSGTVSF